MNYPKRNHYIPQFIIRNFADSDGKVYCFSRKNDKTYAVTPKNVLLENSLYTLKDEFGRKSTQRETEFSRLESRVARLVNRIIHEVSSGEKIISLSEDDRSLWADYLITQQSRHPERWRSIRAEDSIPRIISQIERGGRLIHPLVKAYYLSEPMKEILAKESWLKLNSCDKAQLESKSILMNGEIEIMVADDSHEGFLLGDRPYNRYPRENNLALWDPETRLRNPNSSEITISWKFSRRPSQIGATVISISNDVVAEYNKLVIEQSITIVGRTPEMINRLMKN